MCRPFFLLILLSATIGTVAQVPSTLQSPDGNIRFRLFVTGERIIQYEVEYQQKEIIKASTLGVDGWQEGLSLQSVRQTSKDELWKPVYGERSSIRNSYHAQTFKR
ncbi:glycoside hydrolase family 97 N-terminal domain-containing protein [Flavitalea flava]